MANKENGIVFHPPLITRQSIDIQGFVHTKDTVSITSLRIPLFRPSELLAALLGVQVVVSRTRLVRCAVVQSAYRLVFNTQGSRFVIRTSR